MELGQIEGFLEVARLGHMGRAAAAMSLSQPALTARIQSLEADLGAQLFRRTRAGMTLTPAGETLVPYAERALESLDRGATMIRELSQGVVAELSLGLAPMVGTYVLPEILARFTTDNPDVRLLVRTGHSEEMLDLVVRGQAELAIVREMRDSRVRSRPLYEDELLLVVPPDHPFAHRGAIDVADISTAQLILFDHTSSYYELTNAMFRSVGVAPGGLMELDNVEAAKRMVVRGLGVALLPATAVSDSIAAGTLTHVRLNGAPPIRRRIMLVERLGARVRSRAASDFVDLLDQIPGLVPGARRIVAPE